MSTIIKPSPRFYNQFLRPVNTFQVKEDSVFTGHGVIPGKQTGI